jgi:hypothetical protein
MRLMELHLPIHQFRELHSLDIPVEPARAMREVLAHRPEDDVFFRCAIRIRELPMRLMGTYRRRGKEQQATFGLENFTLLDRDGDSEVAYGLAGKLWTADFGQARIADAQAFHEYEEPGKVKLVVGVACELLPSGLTRVTTETRVHCLDADALRRFRPYWYFIRPVSGMIRRRMLRAIARRCRA